jgi:ribosomal protein S18 acetylase RimI-like enzyme
LRRRAFRGCRRRADEGVHAAGAPRRGVGSALLRHVEDVCRGRGITSLRLDTRAELAEACALYERLGFVRVPPFNDDPYSDRWYAKALAPG